MKRNFLLKISIFFLVLAGLGFLAAKDHFKSAPVASSASKSLKVNPFVMQGVDYTAYENALPVMRIRADEIKINPRKILAFNIRKINEVTITNARMEIYLTPNSRENNPFSYIERTIAPILLEKDVKRRSGTEFGLITRGVVKKMNIVVLDQQKPVLSIQANTAVLDLKKNKVKMQSACVNDPPTERSISGETIFWDGKNKCFSIPGPYSLISPSGNHTGHKIQFDLNLKEITTSPSI